MKLINKFKLKAIKNGGMIDEKQSSFDVADYGSSIDLIVDLENNKVEMIEQ